MLAAPMTQAENLSVDQAKDAAAHFLQHNTTLTRVTADQLTLAHQWNNETLGVPSMYLFAAPSEGWIVMAATTAIDPVVAYSDENAYDGRMAPQQQWWLEGCSEYVSAVQALDAEKPLGDSPEWTALANHALKGGTKASVTLMKTKWDQGGPQGNDYNMFSPVINDSVAPTGCVATALAQICKYYEYPKQPKGRVSYRNDRDGGTQMAINFDTVAPLDYSLMPNEIRFSTTQERRVEVSRLDYYVGMSVKMQFGPALSGSQDDWAVSGMKTNMKYTRGTLVERRFTNDTAYLNKVRRELLMNRPVYMSGVSSSGGGAHAGGHAWVCDGYKEEDSSMYHMNWGWGGTGNAFYNLRTNSLQINGQPYNFSRQQSVITGMIPPQDSTAIQVGVVEVENVAELGRPYPNPATLSVTLPYSTREAADLTVYSVSGRMVTSQRVQAGEGEVTLRVDALPSGIYIYRLGDAHGKFVVR